MAGSIARGTPNSRSSSSSHSRVRRSISSVRLALVTSVTWAPPSHAAGEIPDHPRVDRAEQRFAALGRLRARRRRSRGSTAACDPEKYVAGGRPVRSRSSAACRLRARWTIAFAARVLPDDRVVPGTSGFRIPDDRGLALIGDADRGEVRAPSVRRCAARRAITSSTRAAISQRIVLDPAGLRQDLLVLELMAGDLGAALVEHHEARAGRSLIDGADVAEA